MLERTKDPLDDAQRSEVTRPGATTSAAGTKIVAAAVAAVAAIAALALSACSSSSKSTSTSTSSAATSTGSSSASSAGGSPGATLTGDAATIRDVYLRFLDLKVPVEQKVGLIQDGSDFLTAMQAEAKNPQAATVSLQVSDVKVTSDKLAQVTYTILVSGSPLLPNQKGYAVKEDGNWKIAGITFCGLLSAQNPTAVPPVCSKPAATSLPS